MSVRIPWPRPLLAGLAVLVAVGAALVAPTPAFASTGRVFRSAASVSDSATTKTVRVICPQGTMVLGGGGIIINGGQGVQLARTEPSSDGSGWIVTASEIPPGFAGTWSVTVQAVCGIVSGYQQVVSETLPANAVLAHTTAACPPGKKIIGAGGRATNVNFILDSIDIRSDLSDVRVETFSYDLMLHAPGPTVRAIAICITPLASQQRVIASAPFGSVNATASATCPAPLVMYGVGGGLAEGQGGAHLSTLRSGPDAFLDAREHPAGFAGSWAPYVTGVCAVA
jgi:hypothetical protein